MNVYPVLDLLRLQNLQYLKSREEKGSLIIEVKSVAPEAPQCCLFHSLRKLGTKAIQFRDFTVQAQPVWLEVKRQRFQCRSCGAVLYEDLPELDPDRRVTVRFRAHLEKQSVEHTFSDAARINGVHETLIRRIFKDYADRMLKNYIPRLPRVLGMDEKHILGANRFVIGDVEKRCMLDFQESRYTQDLNAYFDQVDGHDRVEVVTQDMWKGYLQVTKRQFPKAVTVIDKYHVQRLANFGVEFVRKALYLGMPNKERVALKRRNKLFLVRWDEAKPETQDRLAKLFLTYPSLQVAYTLKERFYDIYESQDRAAAERALDKWLADIPADMERPFKEALSAVGNWRPHILRYFEHRYTNAYIERLNGLVTTLNRNAAGLSYDILRAKALLKFGELRPLDHIYAFDLMSVEPEEQERLLSTMVGFGVDLSTLEAAIRDGSL